MKKHIHNGVINPKTIILLTSTVRPFAEMPNNLRSDPVTRLDDYRKALSFYINLPEGEPDEIILTDNSGYDILDVNALGDFTAAKDRKVTLLSIAPSVSNCNSKPFGELDIQDQTFLYLKENYDPSTIVWKITGRLIVKNIQSLIRSRPSESQLYCDLRDAPFIGSLLGGNPWFDMRMWSYSIKFYETNLYNLKNQDHRIDEGRMFRYTMGLLKGDGSISPRFRVQPQFSGHLGATNQSYDRPSVRTKDLMRSFARKYMPGLWL